MLDNICLQILLELLGKMFLGAFEEPAVIAATIWIEDRLRYNDNVLHHTALSHYSASITSAAPS